MKIMLHKNKVKNITKYEKNLGFVPTMGAIHAGHISLIKKSKKECDKTVVSIFVNKPQFNRKSDFLNYPKRLKKDIAIIKKTKADILFLPEDKEIYPNGKNRKVRIDKFHNKLCGKFRPGHFNAVVDVVDRFAKIINPYKIYLGEKDMQQLKLIKSFFAKKHPKIKIVECKTIREKNGLALSSRNFLLSEKQKLIGSKIYRFLISNKKKIISKKTKISEIKNNIVKIGATKIEYLEALNVNRMIKPYFKKKKYKIFISYYLGKIRLIDNF